MLSKILEVETHRLDSDYQKKKYLKIENKIKNNQTNFSNFTTEGLRVDASAFYPSLEPYYGMGNFPFLRVADVDTNIDYDKCIKLPIEIIERDSFKTLKIIKKGDVIITKGGSIGRVGLIEKDTAVTRDLIFINSSLLPEIDYKFLFLYLLSNISYDLMIRSSSMTAQPHLTIKLIRDLPLFVSSSNFKGFVSNLYDKSQELKNNSKQTYTQAENILLQEVGLQDFTPSKSAVNIKSFKDSFATSGRLDAEYYQAKYEDYINLIMNYSGGFDKIRTICNLKNKNYKPQINKKYNYIELSNVEKKGSVNGCTVNIGQELPSRARRKINTNDVIVSSIEGSLNSCALIGEKYDNALCSTGFYVVNSEKINSETLLVLFKSELMQNILKQNCSGTILTGLNKDDFLDIKIPIIDYSKQQQIAELVEESFILKQQREHLLEVAKKAVEIAIEENEAVAMEYIKQERKKVITN